MTNEPTTPEVGGEWIEHKGGPMPTAPVAEVMLRTGDCFTGSDLSDDRTWLHIWGEADIVAYRLVSPPAVQEEGRCFECGCLRGPTHCAVCDYNQVYGESPTPSPAIPDREEIVGVLRQLTGLFDAEGNLAETGAWTSDVVDSARSLLAKLEGKS